MHFLIFHLMQNSVSVYYYYYYQFIIIRFICVCVVSRFFCGKKLLICPSVTESVTDVFCHNECFIHAIKGRLVCVRVLEVKDRTLKQLIAAI